MISNGQVIGKPIIEFKESWANIQALLDVQSGMIAYDTTNSRFVQHDGLSWTALSASTLALTSAHLFVGDAANIAADIALSGDATITNAGVLTIGTLAHDLSVLGDSAPKSFVDYLYETSAIHAPAFAGLRARGSLASPVAVQDTDVLARFTGRGYHETVTPGFSSSSTGRIDIVSSQAQTDTAFGTRLEIYTTPNDSTTIGLAATFGQDKSLIVAGEVSALNLAITAGKTITATDDVTIATASITLANGGSLTLPAAAVAVTGGGTLALTATKVYTFPIITDTLAGLGTANVFTANQTISNTAPSLVLTDTTASAKSLTVAVDANIVNLRESAGASGSLLVLDLANNRVGIGTTGPGAHLQITNTTDIIGQIIKANATQTTNLQEWQNSSGTVLTQITPLGAYKNHIYAAPVANTTYNSFDSDITVSGSYIHSAQSNALALLGSSSYTGTFYGYRLYIQYENTHASSNATVNALYMQNEITSGALKINVSTGGVFLSDNQSEATIASLIGLKSTARVSVGGAITNLTGIEAVASGIVGSYGTITNLYGARVSGWGNQSSDGAVVTTAYGYHLAALSATGTVTNAYGIYLNNISGAATLNYAIYTNAGLVHFGDTVDLASGKNLTLLAGNITTDTTTGTKIGTATTQKIAFFNSTPVVQQTGVAAQKVNYTTGDLDTEAELITAFNTTNAAINTLRTALNALGLMSVV